MKPSSHKGAGSIGVPARHPSAAVNPATLAEDALRYSRKVSQSSAESVRALVAFSGLARPRRLATSVGTVRLVLVAGALPTAALWLAEWSLGLGMDNLGRCVGAIPLGAAVAWVIGLAIAGHLPTDTPPVSGVH